MTLLEPATTISSTETVERAEAPTQAMPLEHPSFGHARHATVHPETMTLYRVSVGDDIIGYLEAAGPIWVALAGPLANRAVEVGQHRIFAAALRMLTDPT